MVLMFIKQTGLAVMFCACLRAHAAQWSSDDAHVSFTLPSDPAWHQIKPPRNEAKLVFQQTNGAATIFFTAFEKKHEKKEINEKVAAGWEKGFFRKSNTTKLSSEFFDFKGKHAYKVLDEHMVHGTKFRGLAIVWLNDGRLCSIVASKVDGAPMQDNVIKAFVESTTFLPKHAN
jgi:hypothetical protein